MNSTAIFICRDPRRAEWQLGRLPPAAGRLTLIGWKADLEPVDAGVPGEVAAVLGRALTSVGAVTFLSSPSQLASTTVSEAVRPAFDDAGYPWWLQGQVLLISASNAAPRIEREQLLSLVDEDWASAAARLAPSGIAGVVRPGVDGDVAGLLSLTDGFDELSLTALEREARLASFDWSVVTEDAFARQGAASGTWRLHLD